MRQTVRLSPDTTQLDSEFAVIMYQGMGSNAPHAPNTTLQQESRAIAERTEPCIEFYNKSIIAKKNTATLSTRTNLGPKPAQNTSNHV